MFSRANSGETGGQEEGMRLGRCPSMAVYSPFSSLQGYEVAVEQSLGSPWGFPSLSQLETISVNISHHLVFQQSTSAAPPKMLPPKA